MSAAGYWRAAVVVGLALGLWAGFEWGVPRQGALVQLQPLPVLHPNQRIAQAQHLFLNVWTGAPPHTLTPSPPFSCLSCACGAF
jgi:hypothetical protein